MPNSWVMGMTIGIGISSDDHVWVIHRGNDPGNLDRTELEQLRTQSYANLDCRGLSQRPDQHGSLPVLNSADFTLRIHRDRLGCCRTALRRASNVEVRDAWHRGVARRRQILERRTGTASCAEYADRG